MSLKNCPKGDSCNSFFIPLNDLLSVVNGKWKIRLILCLSAGPKRFNEIKKCHLISARILSRELKDLEENAIINRKELNDNLKSVEYALSTLGEELIPIIIQLQQWGQIHRKRVLELNNNN